ncbi:MAG: Sugar phosphate isomerase/epimerase [Pedosphaera sp.]|nr:Sugar phosphate isomerase/epimerase [Pedosphaera sp.]
MKHIGPFNRRRFLQTGLLGSTALAAVAALPAKTFGAATKAERDPFDGLKFGMASYTLRKFTLDEAIAMTKQVGLKYINLKDVHLSLKSSPAERQEARKKIETAGLTLMGGGVIYIKNEPDKARAIFEYAKDAGMPTIVCSPDPEALDTVEKLAKEYDLRIAIHNHGPTDKKYPSPLDVLKLVKNRDARLGICMDVGHTVRIGEDPVVVIEQCVERLYDFHMKDVTTATAKGAATEVGKGVIDIVAVLKTLAKQKFSGHIGLEYEANGEAPMTGVVESIAYMRGVLAAIA